MTLLIHQAFENQALINPEKTAVSFYDDSLSFNELNSRANQFARYLLAKGISSGDLIGISLNRSIETIVCLLGILKAGGAYLPLDPNYPPNRLGYMIKDSRIKHIVVYQKDGHPFNSYNVNLLETTFEDKHYSKENLSLPNPLPHTAYVLYTSGSTGNPKGVIGTHAGIMNRFIWMWEKYPFTEEEICCQKTTLNFGDSLWEIFGPLLQGIHLVLLPEAITKDPKELVKEIQKHRITRIVLVPSLLQNILDYSNQNLNLTALKIISISGETPTRKLLEQFFTQNQAIKLLNLYGSTEISADVSSIELLPNHLQNNYIPIGQPISNMQIFILDENGQEAVINQQGEICVAGVGLAEGYLHKQELTDKVFCHCQIGYNQIRIYKTGDMGFRSVDDTLFYAGRKDNQIKLRGYRIELSEIEEKLRNIEGISSAVVLLKQDHYNLGRLEAWLQPCRNISKQDLSALDQQLYSQLIKHLPEYMVPARFHFIHHIPLTPSGKIDRLKLETMEPDNFIHIVKPKKVKPVSDLEKNLYAIWCTLLETEDFGIHDNIFTLGVHSLLITQCQSHIQDKLGILVPVHEFYLKKTIASMAIYISHSINSINLPREVTNSQLAAENVASSAQNRMYILNKLSGRSDAYNITFEVKLSGHPDRKCLEKSLNILIERHATLCTHFRMDYTTDVLLQENNDIDSRYFKSLQTKPENYSILIENIKASSFDLNKGPLFRCYLIVFSSTESAIIFSAHHSIIDGYSFELLFKELEQVYNMLLNKTYVSLPEIHTDYVTFSKQQQAWLSSDDYQDKLSFWKKHLQQAPQTSIPDFCKKTARKRMDVGATYSINIKKISAEHIHDFSKQNETSTFTCLMAIFSILMQRYTNQNDLVIGFPISDRQYRNSDRVAGLFVNTLPMRIIIQPDDSFKKVLQKIKVNLLDFHEHQSVPFDKIVEAVNPVRNGHFHPLFQILFAYEKISNKLNLGNIQGEFNELTNLSAKFDLTLTIQEYPNQFKLNFEYSPELYKPGSIKRMAEHYQNLLSSTIQNANVKISALNFLTDKENHCIQSWQTSFAKQLYSSIPDLIVRHALTDPNKTAVICGSESLNYQQLNNESNQLAYYLQYNGIEIGSKILVCLNKTPHIVTALLAVMKIGGVFIPIDPKYPRNRIDFIICDANPDMILTDSESAHHFHACNCPLINIKTAKLSSAEEILFTINPDATAYIIYTSGSTGTPKGVEVSHGTMASAFVSWNDVYQLESIRAHLQMASFGFDVFIGDFIRALCSGSKLVLCRYEELLEPAKIYNLLHDNQVECAEFVPAVVRALAEYMEINQLTLSHLKILICGSDTWTLSEYYKLKKLLGPNVRIINSYGLTEAGIDSAYFEDPDFSLLSKWDENENLPLGKAYPNNNIHILQGESYAPVGVTGELCISGPALAKGYYQLETLTQERFCPITLNNKKCTVYRTGDLAKYTANGHIKFLGRNDLQIKLNGNRIDLQEIEQRLKLHKAVVDAKVILTERVGRKTLAAFCILSPDDPLVKVNDLLAYLSESLPGYMIPASLSFIDSFPLTPNGKIDRKALSIINPMPAYEINKAATPRTQKQKILADIWQNLLKFKVNSIHENFFRMGGDSILCISMLSKAAKQNLYFSAMDIFKNPTIATLAKAAKLQQHVEKPKIVKPVITEQPPLLPIQQWFFEKNWHNSNHWSQYIVLEINNVVNLEWLLQAVEYLPQHHDTLRSCFYEKNGKQVQEIQAQGHNVSCIMAGKKLTIEQGVDTLAKAINIEKGHVFKAMAISDSGQSQASLILLAHHLVIDGVSWRILCEDLLDFYTQLSQQKAVVLPEKTDSYQQWAEVLNEYAFSEQILPEISFWQKQLNNNIPLPCIQNIQHLTSGLCQARIDTNISEKLRSTAHRAYQTEINDLLLASLIMAIGSFNSSNNVQLSLMLEGHGRQNIHPGVDLSRTVGWFTSEFPISLNVDDSRDVEIVIKSVKQQLRAIPARGIGYGILKYLNKFKSGFQSAQEPLISFNHLGQWLENDKKSLLNISRDGIQLASDAKNENGYPLEIETLFIQGHLQIDITYSNQHFDANIIKKFIHALQKSIAKIVTYCLQESHFAYITSDFPETDISQEHLDQYFNHKIHLEDIYPLSPLQQGLLLHHIHEPNSDDYIVQTVLEIKGSLHLEYFKQAWQILVAKHPILRTGFIWKNLGEPLQYVVKQIDIDWSVDKLNDQSMKSYLAADRARKFDLSHWKLQRLRLLENSPYEWHVLWTHHHILLDGWSTESLLHELFSTYFCLITHQNPHYKNRLSYKDYIRGTSMLDINKAHQFWSNQLKNIDTPSLLSEYYVKDSKAFSAVDTCSYQLEETVYISLKQLENTQGLTLNSILLSLWGLLLNHYLQQDTIVTGTVVSGRNYTGIKKIRTTIGLLANSIPVCFDCSADEPVLHFIKKTQEDLAASNDYSYLPLAKILNTCSFNAQGNLFDTLFVYENFEEKKYPHRADLAIKELLSLEKSEFPLAVIINPKETLEICFTFHSDKFSKTIIDRLLHSYLTALQNFVKQPALTLKQLNFIVPEDYLKITHEWNQSQLAYPHSTLHKRFEQQALKTPKAIALEACETCLTYAALNQQANQLAHYLHDLGVQIEDKICIVMHRSVDYIVAVLACLKSGACFVPLDPGYPVDRLEFMLKDSQANYLITDTVDPISFTQVGCELINFRIIRSILQRQPGYDLNLAVNGSNLAYMIYTSGTTGLPKGVLIEHHSVINLAYAQISLFQINKNSRILNFAPTSFDASISEIATTLLSGACLVLLEKNIIAVGEVLENILHKKAISVITLPPVVLASLNNLFQIKTLVVAGDKSSKELLDKWHQKVRLINAYGPTENTVCATMQLYDPLKPANTIGKPIANVTCQVLNKYMQPVAIGVTGCLYLGGAGVARGYHNRDIITREKFIGDLYNTGDLVRYLPDGEIEYLGRRDTQIKIRGFRVELEEIESIVRQGPLVKSAAIIVQSFGSEKSLIAFVVPSSDSFDKEQLLEFLSARLPHFMKPNLIITLKKLPLSPNSKIDRRRLMELAKLASMDMKNSPPQNLAELQLADIWQTLLNRPKINRHHHFFAMGGNSITCIRMISQIKKVFGIDISMSTVFEKPVLHELASHLIIAEKTEFTSVAPMYREQAIPLTDMQRSMLFLSNIENSNLSYIIPIVYSINGPLNISLLQKSFEIYIAQQDILRSKLFEKDHRLYLQVDPDFTFKIDVISCDHDNEREEQIQLLLKQPFNMTEKLMRVCILQNNDGSKYTLMILFHHAIFDEWSMKLLLHNISSIYQNLQQELPITLPVLPIQYGHYALQEERFASTSKYQTQLNFWKTALHGIPEMLQLPLDYPRPSVKSYKGDIVYFEIEAQDAEKLLAVSADENTTLFMALLGILNLFLYRYTNDVDIVVGTPITSRFSGDYENLVGCFINTLALRTSINGNINFSTLLKQVKSTCLNAFKNQEISFAKVVEALKILRSFGKTPLFQVMMVLEEQEEVSLDLIGTDSTPVEVNNHTAKTDLTFTFQRVKDRSLQCQIEFASDLFNKNTVVSMGNHFKTLFHQLVTNLHLKIDELPMVSAEERAALLNQPVLSFKAPANNLHQWFEQQVLKYPTKVAVVYENESLSYQALNERANQLAYLLKKKGVRLHDKIALSLERSLQLPVAIIAILKTGACYVPVDPLSPADRVLFILKDSAAPVLLTNSHFAEKFKSYTGTTLYLNHELQVKDEPKNNLNSAIPKDSLAYIIYTSGSTGIPKGVMISHYNAMRLFLATENLYRFNENDHWSLFHSYAFDFSVWEIWGALLYGGTLHVIPHLISRSPIEFYQYLATHHITILNQTPSAFAQLVAHESQLAKPLPLSLRYIIFGGEALNLNMLKPWFDCHGDETPQIINMYGITETTVHVTYCRIAESTMLENKGSIIGQRIPDLTTYILNSSLEPVPSGILGELYVGGAGVSQGYLNRETLTQERFIQDPFSSNGNRLYKTGDYARFLADGSMEYLGRIDEQVKIRGYRIELGEIESILCKHPLIKDGAVIALMRGNEKVLTAYFVTHAEDQFASKRSLIEHIRQALAKQLPEYMVPTWFQPIKALPMTINGKLDKKKLSQIPIDSFQDEKYVAPANELETLFCQVWEDILQLKQVSVTDNFFRLGGNSINSYQMIASLQQLGYSITVQDLFLHPSIAELAKLTTKVESTKFMSKITHLKTNHSYSGMLDVYPLSSMQQIIVNNYGSNQTENGIYHSQLCYKIVAPAFYKNHFKTALGIMVKRHSCFNIGLNLNILPNQQFIRKNTVFHIDEQDLSAMAPISQDLFTTKYLQKDREMLFNVHDEQQPLFRFSLFLLNKNYFQFFVSLHHAIEDGWGIVEFLKDLFATYECLKNGEFCDDQRLTNVHKHYIEHELDSRTSEIHRRFWLDYLSSPSLRAAELSPLQTPSQAATTLELDLNTEVTQDIKKLSLKAAVTLKSIYLCAVMNSLSAMDIAGDCLGVVSNGGRRVEIDGSLKTPGLFWNLLPVRKIAHQQTMKQINHIHHTLCEIDLHALYPLDQIEKDLKTKELFSTTFNYIQFHNMKDLEQTMEILDIKGSDKFHYPLNIVIGVDDIHQKVELRLDYSSSYFTKETIQMLAETLMQQLNRLTCCLHSFQSQQELGIFHIKTLETDNKAVHQGSPKDQASNLR